MGGHLYLNAEEMETSEIIVTDNCPGMSDDISPIIFYSSGRGNITKSGKGPGLFIVRSRVEIYGGRKWAGDIFPGKVGTGTAIHFFLKKAA
jgi:signal transduction histidine kinase